MNNHLGRSVKHGILGGLVGGIIFGIIMQMMGQLSMIAGMMGSESLTIGWLLHLMISLVFGAIFGYVAYSLKSIWFFTLLFGFLIWVIGPLTVMPLMMGMDINLSNAFSSDQLMSLGTHFMFSVIVAIVYKMGSVKKANSKVAA
ncbi:hypothetical protein [Metabacillus indicus]|uniref:hypothetical protein n=1 Tax=Metabacillus indicus TaxID=246786 RepID=UPI003CF48415